MTTRDDDMRVARRLPARLGQAEWWTWAAMAGLLALGLSGAAPVALSLAPLLAAAQALYRLARSRSLLAFPVQVRLAYLALLLLGHWTPLGFLHWIQLAGTTALLSFDYCALARTLSLAPWNRRRPLDLTLLRYTFLSAPGSWWHRGAP